MFVFTTQTNMSVLNWMALISIERNIDVKMWNKGFPLSKTEYVITLLKWLVWLILFLFLVVYRSSFKIVLTIFRVLFRKKPYYPVSFLPHHFNWPVITLSDYTETWILKNKVLVILVLPLKYQLRLNISSISVN